AEALRDGERHHEHGDHHGDPAGGHRGRALPNDHRGQVVVCYQSHAVSRLGCGLGLAVECRATLSGSPTASPQPLAPSPYAARRSASTISNRDAIVAGMKPATRPMNALSPSPTAAFVLLTPNTGMNAPAWIRFGFTITRARPTPSTPPMIDIRSASPATSRKIVDEGKPSVRMTAISVVRSRTDIAIVLPATKSVLITTASEMLPSSRLRLPNIETNELWKARSVSVFVSYGEFANF